MEPRSSYEEPVHHAVFNGWPVQITDPRPRWAQAEADGLVQEAPELEPFEVVVPGFDSVHLEDLAVAKLTAETWARSLPPGGREGAWTEHPEVMREQGYNGYIRFENGHLIELLDMADNLSVQVDGKVVGEFMDRERPGVEDVAQDLGLLYAAEAPPRGAPSAPTEPSPTRPGARRFGLTLAAVLLAAASVASWARSAEASRRAHQAEEAVHGLAERLQRAGYSIPERSR